MPAQTCLGSAALNKVSEIPLHPQSLVGAVHDLDGRRMRSHILARLPSIGLSPLELFVEVDQHQPEDVASNHRDAKHGQHNAVALAVPVLLEVPDVRARDVAELAEGVDHGDGHGALGGRSWEG